MFMDPAFDDRLADLVFQARVWWCIAAASFLALAVLALTFRHKPFGHQGLRVSCIASLRRLRGLHDSDSAIASMEFLMVFFPFLVIVMTVWQLAFMFNAQMHVGYSAYAAARSASVMIPADLEHEKEWELKKLKTSKAEKWQSIQRAAIPGVLPISPGRFTDAVAVLGMARATKKDAVKQVGKDPALLARMALMGAHYGSAEPFTGNRIARNAAKDFYAQSATQVLINGQNNEKDQNLEGMGTIAVTVNYVFYLNVPYVGKLMQTAIEGLSGPLRPYPSILLTEVIHMKLWARTRAIEPCND